MSSIESMATPTLPTSPWAIAHRSRSPSGSAGRRPRTGHRCRCGRARGSARWTPSPCRSRRTGAWSRGARCTSRGRPRGCRGTGRGRRAWRPGRTREVRGVVDRADGEVRLAVSRLCFGHRPEPSAAARPGRSPVAHLTGSSAPTRLAHARRPLTRCAAAAPRASSRGGSPTGARHPPSRWRGSRGTPPTGRCARPRRCAPPTDEVDPLGQHRAQRAVDLRAVDHRVVPRVVGHHVDVAAGPALALTVDHVHLLEVPDRPRDGGRAHLERLPELSRRHAPVVVGQQAREHPGRQPRHTRCGEGGAEALHEPCRVLRGGLAMRSL